MPTSPWRSPNRGPWCCCSPGSGRARRSSSDDANNRKHAPGLILPSSRPFRAGVARANSDSSNAWYNWRRQQAQHEKCRATIHRVEGAMKAQILAAVVLLLALAPPAMAFNCPVVIKQAEDNIKKAEATKTNADTKPLIDEAKKLVAEAKAHHENAKTKKDHGDAIRKAKTASAYAEEAITLASP